MPDAGWEADDRAILARVTVPVFVVEGLPGALAGYAGTEGDEPVESVLVRHELDEDEMRSIDVETERAELDPASPAARCLALLGGAGTPTSTRLPVEGVDREFALAGR